MNYATIVFGSMTYLIQYYANQYLQNDLKDFHPPEPLDYSLPVIETYDFIIVGGGTAGCAVASRLSENPNFSVLLLEIGGNPPPQTEVPIFMGNFHPLEEIVFQYRSVPRFHANTGVEDEGIVVRVGKVLGGTSTINGMFFNRGSPLDYELWANLTEDDTWKYENILPYFKQVETYQGEFEPTFQHGFDGPIPITSQKYAPGLSVWLEAGKELGYPKTDPNGPQTESLGPIEFSKQNGRRVSSYEGYLRPYEASRQNLKIVRYAHVTEVVLGEQNEVTGVIYTKHGVTKYVRAAKEVILSAGAFGTPQILLKSGIGPADELQQLGIQPKVNLPVGKNLREHPLIPLRIIIDDDSHVYKMERDITEEAVQDFLQRGKGPLTSDKSLSAQGFAVSNEAIKEGFPHWPDIQFSLYSQDFPHLNVPKSEAEKNETAIFILPYLGRPQSSGTVKLDPSNISNQPLIDFNFLSHPRDIKVYIEAINKSLEIFETTNAYAKIGARYSLEPVPECRNTVFRSDEYWTCYIDKLIFGGNHASGTCRMGKTSDPSSVVDSNLRVIGVKGLRIIDASAFPTIINSNIQAAVYLLAEKGSADIRREWELVACNG